VSSDWRMVEARACPIRTCPADAVPAAAGRGSSQDGDGDIGVSGPDNSPGRMVLAPRARQAFPECFAGPAV
jgi:hypothetical protein